MEPPADSGPDHEGGSSRRQFIRSLAAISAGLTVAAPLGRAATVTEESIPKSAPPNTGGDPGTDGNKAEGKRKPRRASR